MSAQWLEPLLIRGRYFWQGSKRFLIRGICYQCYEERHADPITDDRLQELRKDIELFRELDINAIHVFSIDNTKKHHQAMKLLAEAGIYVLAASQTLSSHSPPDPPLTNREQGLSTPDAFINVPEGGKSTLTIEESYSRHLLDTFFRSVDVMATYPNTMGVIVANEVINMHVATAAAPYIRAVARDVKRYMRLAERALGQRRLPVGISDSDVLMFRMSSFRYMSAGDPEEAIDFYSFNCYSWAGKSNMQMSGYENQVQAFSGTHIPVFFSEYGADLGRPRLFHETRAIYSPAMTPVFSGAFAYTFQHPTSGYGLVRYRRRDDGDDEVLHKTGGFRSLRKSLRKAAAERPCTLDDWALDAHCAARRPDGPPRSSSWLAGPAVPVPDSLADWDGLGRRLAEEAEWVHVERGEV